MKITKKILDYIMFSWIRIHAKRREDRLRKQLRKSDEATAEDSGSSEQSRYPLW